MKKGLKLLELKWLAIILLWILWWWWEVIRFFLRLGSFSWVRFSEIFIILSLSSLIIYLIFRRLEMKSEELRKTQEQLVQAGKLASTGQLAAGVAHELNNPLTTVSGYAQLLLKRLNKKDSNYKKIEAMAEEANRCKTIIKNLLDFSRPAERKNYQALNVNIPLKNILSLVGEQMRLQNVRITKNLSSHLPRIKANPSQLEQVFMNIVSNALDSMPSGGELRITTSLSPTSVVMHAGQKTGRREDRQTGRRIEIKFADTGCGIKSEDMNKVFNPFFTTKRPGRGVGLGLSVSYGIIREHGGEIGVESEEGKGSTFTISLPIKEKG